MNSTKLLLVALMATIATSSVLLAQVDFSSCADDLDRVRRRASYAADAAREAETAQTDYDQCRSDPKFYDLLRDGCSSKSLRLRSTISDLQSAFDDVARAMRNATSSCGIGTVSRSSITGVSESNQGMCATLRSAKSRLSIDSLMSVCKSNMPESECKACIAAP